MNVEVCTLFEPLNPHKIFILEKRIKKKIKIHRQPIESFIKRRTVRSDMESLKYYLKFFVFLECTQSTSVGSDLI
ncbi:unnamed protein product [Brugia timori]|uniref:Uncharacterized protein n=1 Tax=Brugia timori TaxID=42155 RepID=A0A0R3QUA8_9BILA|nr:unnamed protein product [Brugia timori]